MGRVHSEMFRALSASQGCASVHAAFLDFPARKAGAPGECSTVAMQSSGSAPNKCSTVALHSGSSGQRAEGWSNGTLKYSS